MVDSYALSSVALLAVTALCWALLHLAFGRIGSSLLALALLLACVLAGAVAVTYVDTNVPLAQSHFRPGNEPAAAWAALLAWSARVAAILGLIYFGRWARLRAGRGSGAAAGAAPD